MSPKLNKGTNAVYNAPRITKMKHTPAATKPDTPALSPADSPPPSKSKNTPVAGASFISKSGARRVKQSVSALKCARAEVQESNYQMQMDKARKESLEEDIKKKEEELAAHLRYEAGHKGSKNEMAPRNCESVAKEYPSDEEEHTSDEDKTPSRKRLYKAAHLKKTPAAEMKTPSTGDKEAAKLTRKELTAWIRDSHEYCEFMGLTQTRLKRLGVLEIRAIFAELVDAQLIRESQMALLVRKQ
jgi:hypothetical protein